jgi:hypothetical protein
MALIINRASVLINRSAVYASRGAGTSSGGGGGLTNLSFVSTTNLQESPAGHWIPINNNLDANGKGSVSLPASTDGEFQCEFQSSFNTEQFAICWDTSNAISESYYTTAKYTVFPIFGTYWYNDNQAGAIDSAIACVDGDLLRMVRVGSVIKAQYYRGGSWSDIHTYSGTDTGQMYYFISSAQSGALLTILNPKQSGAV